MNTPERYARQMIPDKIGPTGQVMNGETVILKGIKADEWVVTDGQIRLILGAKLTIKNAK